MKNKTNNYLKYLVQEKRKLQVNTLNLIKTLEDQQNAPTNKNLTQNLIKTSERRMMIL